MNFIFISPNFPQKFWQFCDALKKNGANVLGIGDQACNELCPELKNALTEYYLVSDMQDYKQMYKAVAFFAFKYGPIDWLESNNEFWLEMDAKLRTAFHITSGIGEDKIDSIKEKSEMKKYYALGGIRTARQIKASKGLEAVLNFAEDAGYPLFSKPDVGVGAGGAHKLENEDEVRRFFQNPDADKYVIEEFVTGNICTYDAIVNSQGDPLFESMCVCPPSISDIVEYNLDSTYYVEQHMSENLRYWGRKTVKAFGVQSRFVHLEFFCLDRAHRGLGEIGDFVALEVNMRPGGGFTPDMINYAHSVDVYKIWADMICFDKRTTPNPHEDYFVMFAGRRDNVAYVHSHQDIMEKYKGQLKQWDRLPKAVAGAMGDQTYIARFNTREEMDEFFNYVTHRA
ncbi:MAG: hypothetical protein Q4D12_04315 [Bacteroidales bacterium]|nr:hypothetical protein [Bacteroidales bacterium]